MKNEILDYFKENILSKYSLKKLWLSGIVVWFLFFVFSIIIVIGFTSNELDFIYQFYSSIVSIVFSGYFVLIGCLILTRLNIKKYKKRNRLMKFILSISLGYFLIMNVVPRRIGDDPNLNDSPFDEVWYSIPQSALGYPSPWLRFLDYDLKHVNSPIIDIATLFGNVFYLCFFMYLIVGIYLYLSPVIVNEKIEKTAHNKR